MGSHKYLLEEKKDIKHVLRSASDFICTDALRRSCAYINHLRSLQQQRGPCYFASLPDHVLGRTMYVDILNGRTMQHLGSIIDSIAGSLSGCVYRFYKAMASLRRYTSLLFAAFRPQIATKLISSASTDVYKTIRTKVSCKQ